MNNLPSSEVLSKIGICSSNKYRDETYSRMSWHEYFMSICQLVAKRSHDSQTQHGICLTRDNRIVATGFNGFPEGSPDNILPNIRQDGFKYLFINHAEESAIYNAARRGIALDGCTAYITGHPCSHCCRRLVSVGVKHWIIGDLGHQSTEQEKILAEFWVSTFMVKVTKYSEIQTKKNET